MVLVTQKHEPFLLRNEYNRILLSTRLLMLLGRELTKILPENKTSWLRKWLLRREPESRYQTRLGGFQRQTGQLLNVAVKKKKISRRLLSYGKESYK